MSTRRSTRSCTQCTSATATTIVSITNDKKVSVETNERKMKRKRKESPTASTATARNKITATTVSVECTRSGSGSDSSGSNRSNTNTVHNKTKQAAKLPPTRSGWTMQEALTHLCTADNRFTRVVNSHALPLNFHKKTKAKDAYTTLLQSIIFQQLGIKVAEVIYNRFCSAIGVLNPDDNISPSVVNEAKFSVKDVDGKSKVSVNGAVVGLSNAKSSYIQSLTEHFLDANSLQGIDFDTLSDDETFAKLNVVKGLGAWSIHMFMIFHLHRPDVLPIGDLAVRRGICVFNGISPNTHQKVSPASLKAVTDMCAHWSPYSTLASLYMWKLSG